MTREEYRRLRERYAAFYFARDDLDDALKYLRRYQDRDTRQIIFDLERMVKDIAFIQRKIAAQLDNR